MKLCRSCKKEIDDNATKCPHCQSFQSRWKNPQLISLVFVVPFIVFSIWNMTRLKGEQFSDYKEDIVLSEINKTSSKIIFEINNKSDVRWTNPNIQIVFTDSSGKVIGVKTDSSYTTIVPPKSKTLVEVQVEVPKECESFKATLKSMDNRPF